MRAIIVTGSRHLDDVERVRARLATYDPGLVILHGECPGVKSDPVTRRRGAPGADRIAHNLALELGHVPVPFPADWSLGKKAGPIRNGFMVRTLLAYWRRGDVVSVEAFPLPGSIGTWDCVRQARDVGISVVVTQPEAG